MIFYLFYSLVLFHRVDTQRAVLQPPAEQLLLLWGYSACCSCGHCCTWSQSHGDCRHFGGTAPCFLPSFADSHPALSFLVLWLHRLQIQPRAELLQSTLPLGLPNLHTSHPGGACASPEGEPLMADTSVTRKRVSISQGSGYMQQLQ